MGVCVNQVNRSLHECVTKAEQEFLIVALLTSFCPSADLNFPLPSVFLVALSKCTNLTEENCFQCLYCPSFYHIVSFPMGAALKFFLLQKMLRLCKSNHPYLLLVECCECPVLIPVLWCRRNCSELKITCWHTCAIHIFLPMNLFGFSLLV